MLTVVIPTKDSERALVPTLAALVPGAMAGVVSEVLLADAGSRDDTTKVAEHAGCNFLVMDAPLAQRLNAAAAKARAQWLLFLQPGTVLDATWIGDAQRFAEMSMQQDQAAVFRRGAPMRAGLRDALSLLATTLGRLPRPEQGLLIAKPFHAKLGGHSETATDPESDLIRRIGRQRLTTLPTMSYRALRDT
jgi:hypothetical protein